MEYSYHIIDCVYDWMLSKKKNVEVRILKEKSQAIQEGDFITFNNQDQEGKYIKVQVIKKDIFDNLDDLLKVYDVKYIMPNHTETEIKELLQNIYGDELKHGKLVAFKFEYLSSDQD